MAGGKRMSQKTKCYICGKIIPDSETVFRASNVDKYDICEKCYDGIDKKCSKCGDALIGEEYKKPSTDKQDKIFCDSCYEDEHKYDCEFCEKLRENDEKYYFVITQEVIDEERIEYEEKPMLPGIYRPLKENFTINKLVFGFQGFIDGALGLVVNVDIPGDYFEPCPRICESCVAEYREVKSENNR
jgi:hypothetical protein